MHWQPVLESERVRLRPLTVQDWPALFDIASDPAIWEQHPVHDRWREEVFRGFFEEALASLGALVIEDCSTRQIIGSSRFAMLERDADSDPTPQSLDGLTESRLVEIGWTFLARKYWGKGINQECKRLMLNHAFERADEVRFKVGETNYRSQIALENIGAERTRETELSKYQGKRVLHLVFRITREQFASGPLGD